MSLPLREPGSTGHETRAPAPRAPRARKLPARLEERPRPSAADGIWARAESIPTLVYWGIHLSCLAALWTGVDATALALCAATFWIRMFAITAGYHRYFAHRAYKTSRAFQFALALLGTCAVQKGPLWWSGLHRRHHRYADEPGDTHSPREGFWYAHQGWIFDPRWTATPTNLVPEFARYPELRWLNRWHFVPVIGLAALCFAVDGTTGLVWGFAISTTALWHSTYLVNSAAHLFGTRRYDTPDTSRNNWWIALLTMGEGWHNNHHYYMASARQGFRWWEIDLTYYALRGLAALGVIWDVREPPASARDGRARSAVRAEQPQAG
jgi:stearoyl-CoA desaturase (delta-9 desaturase)